MDTKPNIHNQEDENREGLDARRDRAPPHVLQTAVSKGGGKCYEAPEVEGGVVDYPELVFYQEGLRVRVLADIIRGVRRSTLGGEGLEGAAEGSDEDYEGPEPEHHVSRGCVNSAGVCLGEVSGGYVPVEVVVALDIVRGILVKSITYPKIDSTTPGRTKTYHRTTSPSQEPLRRNNNLIENRHPIPTLYPP